MSLCSKHANRHVPGHGWLGGSYLCRGKSFAQEIGSDRSHNPYHSVHHCTAPGGHGRSRKRRLQTHRKRSVRAQKTSQLKRFKFSVGSGWLERKSCMPNCHQKAFVDNWPTPCRNCTGGEEMKGCVCLLEAGASEGSVMTSSLATSHHSEVKFASIPKCCAIRAVMTWCSSGTPCSWDPRALVTLHAYLPYFFLRTTLKWICMSRSAYKCIADLFLPGTTATV